MHSDSLYVFFCIYARVLLVEKIDMRKLKVRIEDIDVKNPFLIHHADFFINLLRRKYNVDILTQGEEEPDVLFYSCWGGMNNIKWTNCLRIYFTAERDIPDFNMCDYAIGLVNIGNTERFLHFPFYTFYNDLMRKYEQLTDIDVNKLLDRDFCSVVVTDPYRNPYFFEFYKKLNNYKAIASGGRWNNNVNGRVPDKLNFIRNYKFNIAFENMKVHGYVTEKIIEPLVARTIPIYWGSDSVRDEFGEGSYINISDFSSLDEAVEYIKEVDKNNKLYLDILNRKATLPYSYEEWSEIVLHFLITAIEKGERFFDYRCNRVFEQKRVYHKIHTGIAGRIYRRSKRFIYNINETLKRW